jgi:hypothetical protein
MKGRATLRTSLCLLAAAALLAGCARSPTPVPEPIPDLPAPASGSAAPPCGAAAPATAPAPPPAADETDAGAVCERFAGTPFPATDLPTPAERKALAGCDGEALYYGIGRPVDLAAARKCAYVQRDDQQAPPIAGSAILLMVYANGKGAPMNLDLAVRFACESGFAPAERDGRVARVLEGRKLGHLAKELDFCEDITSGYMMGWCSSHEERIASIARDARKRAAAKGLPAAAFERFDKTAAAFFSARSMNEVDMSGTMRGALSVGQQATLEDDHVTTLEHLADPTFTPPAGDAAAAERDLQETYDRLMKCKKTGPAYPGGVGADGIKKTELLWLPYREAWLSLVAEARPTAKRDAWKAWLTAKRTAMLRELKDGC